MNDSIDSKDPSSVAMGSRLCAFHDCASIVSAFNLGIQPVLIDPCRPTGASQAQSPEECDPGDGKSNELLQSCQAFRNELGNEPVRKIGLSHFTSYALQSSDNKDALQTWHREAAALEAGVLENLSNVYFGGGLCAGRQPQIVIEPVDPGAFFYRHCFHSRAHQNYFGLDEVFGPVAISIIRETLDPKEVAEAKLTCDGLYRIIIRLSHLRTFRVSIPEECLNECQMDGNTKGKVAIKEILDLIIPQLNASCLKLAFPVPNTEELLMKLDEQPVYFRYKVGVLYCKAGQSTEEQMYNNEHGSQTFNEFLDMIGQRVRLKGFEGYKGGLDTKGDTTGSHSLYSVHQQHHIMFHVSTLLPFTPSNKQQLSRKRHIGNDMVTVVFQEPGASPFSPHTVRSHFQHVFIVVRANTTAHNLTYSVAVSRSKDVREFGPPLPVNSTFAKSTEFKDFLITKIINAENSVHKSAKFAAMAARTRKEVLKDLLEHHVTSQGIDPPSKNRTSRILHSSKRKDRSERRSIMSNIVRGALAWDLEVDDFSKGCPISCVLGLSTDSLVLIEKPSGVTVFATPCHSIIGWSRDSNCLKVYYDHGAVLVTRCAKGSEKDIAQLIIRLNSVTKGCETTELNLRKNVHGQLGFHVQEEGVVTDVEMYSGAWLSGLRQGSRLVEICRISVATLSLEQMQDLLKSMTSIKMLIIPPTSDGSPRRGCEDVHCPAAKEEDEALAQYKRPFTTNGPKPPSYAEVSKRILNGQAMLGVSRVCGVADLGYESGSWSRDEFGSSHVMDVAPTSTTSYPPVNNAFGELTTSSVSSEERWPPVRTTDTLSSSGSSELSADVYPTNPHRRRSSRPTEIKRNTAGKMVAQNEKYKGDPLTNGPPLPPRTYKRRPSMDHSHFLLSVADASQNMTPIQRCQSEELIRASPSPPTVHSARPILVTGSGDSSENINNNLISQQVMQAAAVVVASKPDLGLCQLRLQAALQRIKNLEVQVERLTNELEKERNGRHDLESEVVGLREDRVRLVEERTAAECELTNFTDWVCRATITNDNQARTGDC